MPSSKEIKADVIARVLAERFDAVTLRHADDPVDVSRIHREMADDVLTALSAAEKEREGEDGYLEYLKSSSERDAVREGDIIEKLREWLGTQEAYAKQAGSDYAIGQRHAYALAKDFLNDRQEQSTPKEEACGQVGVGHGGDTWDPVCDLPAGHAGRCNWSGEPAQEQSTGEEQ